VTRPLGRQFLGHGDAWCRREQGGILVPGGDQDLGAPRGRMQAADDEAKEPAAGVRGDVRAEIAG
jgi:hypothetical protein